MVFYKNKPFLLALVILLYASLMTSCGAAGEQQLFGTPTPIPPGKSPVDVIIQIQDEFRALKKPLLKKLKYHKKWEVKKFADSTYRYGPFQEVVLTGEAYAFFKKYTLREICTALTPLLFDPEIGGEVAVLLSGIPAQSREQASELHRGRDLVKLKYISPSNKGDWNIKSRIGKLYIGFPGIQFDVPDIPPEGTLDHAIYTVLQKDHLVQNYPAREYYEPYEHLFAGRVYNKKFKRFNEFTDLLGDIRPTRKFQTFVAAHADLFSATVLLANPQRNRGKTSLMWTLGLEKQYLPLSVFEQAKDQRPFFHGSIQKHIRKMEEELLYTAGRTIFEGYSKGSQ